MWLKKQLFQACIFYKMYKSVTIGVRLFRRVNIMYLIFDFDGTLIDSFGEATEKFNCLAEQFNLKRVKKEETDKIRDLSSKELIKYLQIPLYKLPQVLYQARKNMRKDLLTLPPFANLTDVLNQLRKAGHSLGILTSNSIENVSDWLKHNNIHHLFNFLHSESNYFGKRRILKKIMKTYGIDKSNAYYFGDETRDIEAAKQNNMHAVAVTWGFNSEMALAAYHPHFIAKKPEDILTICGIKHAK